MTPHSNDCNCSICLNEANLKIDMADRQKTFDEMKHLYEGSIENARRFLELALGRKVETPNPSPTASARVADMHYIKTMLEQALSNIEEIESIAEKYRKERTQNDRRH